MAVRKCLLGILPFVCFALAVKVIDDDDVPELEWPQRYTIDIIKVSISNGLEETLKVWQDQSSQKTRVDYNNGVVKRFYFGEKDNATKIEIHPVAYDSQNIEFICHELLSDDDDFIKPNNILPLAFGYKRIGKEVKNGISASKFRDEKYGATLWASYNESSEEWIPVKYEKISYDDWRGSVKDHNIWDFENYESDFNEEEVFNFEQFCEENETTEIIRHEMNDEVVTKHLIFMDPENNNHVNHVFEAFKTKYKKNYADKTEHAIRKAIFHRNMRLIVSANRKNIGYKLSVTHLSDRTPEELKRHKGLKYNPTLEIGTYPFPYNESQLQMLSNEIPTEYDLRLLGVISPVQEQADCGSCWAFATTSTAEGALSRSNGGNLVKLSTQALIDCSWEFGNSGCDGGNEANAYQWMEKYGMPTEEEYGAYTVKDGICKIQYKTKMYRIKGFTKVTPKSVGALKVALYYHGPVSISIYASNEFEQYSSGILYDITCDENNANHVVTLVGYGEVYGETYWILKNSYGTDWGIDGYIYISAKNDNCGVMSNPMYVIY